METKGLIRIYTSSVKACRLSISQLEAAVRQKYIKKFVGKFGLATLRKMKAEKLGPTFHLGDNPDKRTVWQGPFSDCII